MVVLGTNGCRGGRDEPAEGECDRNFLGRPDIKVEARQTEGLAGCGSLGKRKTGAMVWGPGMVGNESGKSFDIAGSCERGEKMTFSDL